MPLSNDIFYRNAAVEAGGGGGGGGGGGEEEEGSAALLGNWPFTAFLTIAE